MLDPTASAFESLSRRYRGLRIAVVGDFCLDRYLEIDPTIAEVSLETGLPVQHVARVRAQPGGAGTIVANLAALGVGHVAVVGVRGDDGEGYELQRALDSLPGVDTRALAVREDRPTFSYTKPVVCDPGLPPRELQRLDHKSRVAMPSDLQALLATAVARLAEEVDALILMEQVEIPETGVVCAPVRAVAGSARARRPGLFVLADSRRGLGDHPAMGFKMNTAEFARTTGTSSRDRDDLAARAGALARRTGHPVFVTLAEDGILGSLDGGQVRHAHAPAVKGPIDVVGAGDAVTANLTAALTAGGDLDVALRAAMAAASIVVHQLGTTGTASAREIVERLGDAGSTDSLRPTRALGHDGSRVHEGP